MKQFLFILLCGWFTLPSAIGQANMEDHVMFHVLGAYDNDTTYLIGANVYWANTTDGTATSENGVGHLQLTQELPHDVVISYVGFYNDTVTISEPLKRHHYVFLINREMLHAVEIVQRRQTQFVSTIEAIKTEIIGEGELKRAACCDLSESFETNATVDVSYSDAVTGAKEISLLGLDGVYVEMLHENVPTLRGLAIPFGLTYVPGPWVSSIYVSKGTGTIVHGHESITGSINFKYKEPLDAAPLTLDLFGNHLGRYEANAVSAIDLSDKVGTLVAFNAGGQHSRADNNDDGFMDQPMYNRFNVMNRWKFIGDKFRSQIFVNYLRDDRISGQSNYRPELHEGEGQVYGIGLKTDRVEAYGKTGYVFEDKPEQSIGTVYSVNWHDTEGYFGNRYYEGSQLSFNGTFLFQTIFRTTDHGFVSGANFHSDHYRESFEDIVQDDDEWDIGIFAEYTYSLLDQLKLVAGLRVDYHSEYDVQVSPRLHIKYTPHPLTTLRFTAGKGFRSPRVLGENISLMASSREFVIEESVGMEAAWNTGASFIQTFNVAERQGSIGVDFFHTRFTDQVLVDVNQRDNTARFYNLDGRSYSNSLMVEAGLEVAKGFDIRVAYKYDVVKETYNGELQDKPFNYKHKGLLVAAYTSPSRMWQVDMNLDLHGKHTLPASFEGQMARTAPLFVLLNMQVSRFFDNGVEIYIGGENMTNFTQKHPIIGADAPFDDPFDTSQVWGPVVGGVFYGGLRYTLARKNGIN